MHSTEQIAYGIVQREGGFVNDPDDLGGATNFGVTIHTMRSLGLDLDGDGDVDVSDVKALTLEVAVDIFLEHYFQRPGVSRLPEQIQATVFDMYVNAGSNAVKILQELINQVGLEAGDLVVDGAIGPITAAAAYRAQAAMGEFFRNAYGIARREYYYKLADGRPQSRKYARRRNGGKGGWIVRAEEFIHEKYHFTESQHRNRVAAWS